MSHFFSGFGEELEKLAVSKGKLIAGLLAALGGGAYLHSRGKKSGGSRTKKGGGGYVDRPKVKGLLSASTKSKPVESLKQMMLSSKKKWAAGERVSAASRAKALSGGKGLSSSAVMRGRYKYPTKAPVTTGGKKS